jgi:hypothetical protein
MTPAALQRHSSGVAASAPDTRAIPFDYAFRYRLEGSPGKVQNSVVSVSIEAMFTAVSISYGVVAEVQPIVFGPAPPRDTSTTLKPTDLLSLQLAQVFDGLDAFLTNTGTVIKGQTGAEAVFKNGLKLNPAIAEFALQGGTLSVDSLGKLFQVVGSPSDLIQFKYAIFDEGSGREFQSEPILNIAGLGSAAGERPFRHFAQPITFGPRATIRLEITEVSDFKGELHVVLQGYKVLGNPGSPTAVNAGSRRRR